ncbi:hypothetical protein FGB62_48g13 [Gracilaria domingensis]|nr:hypothetical protein FGB62_48g13 [Gracilaria domingensis]
MVDQGDDVANLRHEASGDQTQESDEQSGELTERLQPDVASATTSSISNGTAEGFIDSPDSVPQDLSLIDTSEQPSDQSIQTTARIATVIYDMLIRGSGDNTENEAYYLELINTFPVSAALAREYATHVAETIFQPMQYTLYAQQAMRHRRENPIVAIRNHGSMAGMRTSFSPNLHITTVFLIPIVTGLVYAIIGGLLAITVNMGLNAIGGIRYEAHED